MQATWCALKRPVAVGSVPDLHLLVGFRRSMAGEASQIAKNDTGCHFDKNT